MAVNPIDLTTVQRVKDWLGGFTPGNSSDDENIQSCITSASNYWLLRTGRGPADGSVPATSPLVEPGDYDEFFDGDGGPRQFVRITPIVSVQLVKVFGVSIPQSPDKVAPGWVIDQTRKSIAIIGAGSRSGTGAFALGRGAYGVPGTTLLLPGGWRFAEGIQNVHIQYMAGFTAVPPDIEDKCRQMVAVNYRRRSWIDQKSQAMANGAGTVSFRDWKFPPECEDLIINYTRRAPVY